MRSSDWSSDVCSSDLPDLTLAVPDHNVPTTPRRDAAGNKLPIADPKSAAQLAALEKNAPDFGIRYIDAVAPEQGIVHVVGPEQGFSLPGTPVVCGDSPTACPGRSEKRRVGKECVSTCRSRGSPGH